MLARRGLPVWHRSNPFWRYAACRGAMLALALGLGGWEGLALFLWQAGVAVWQLELVNYIEHYGLTRRHLGEGKYEHVLPRHSWNASHRASNWLLINLQRHSDHHYKPDRRFPLLQTYAADEAPQLPYGYPVMTTLAMIPPLWKRVMNRGSRRGAAALPRHHRLAPLQQGAEPRPARGGSVGAALIGLHLGADLLAQDVDGDGLAVAAEVPVGPAVAGRRPFQMRARPDGSTR
jgi:hypothetical protein